MKTADELHITQAEKDGLVWVRDGLRAGKFKHIDEDKGEYPLGQNGFNMSIASKSYECGTVGCIGGWVWVHMNIERLMQDGGVWYLSSADNHDADTYLYQKGPDCHLHHLYFPPGSNYDAITPLEAAQAIDNYLNTGDPDWESVIEAP